MNRTTAPTSCLFRLACVCLALAAVCTAGCGSQEKEATPVVSVQVTPAHTGEIALVVSSEAVVFPLQQAVVAPKITSTIKTFLVQRGSRVHKGQLLAVLENADLSAASSAERARSESSFRAVSASA